MRILFLLLLITTLGAETARAQSAERFFHEAGGQFIAEKVPEALQTVNAGLAAFPSDPKLQALKKKIEEEQKGDGGGSGGSGEQGDKQNEQGQQKPDEKQPPSEEPQQGDPQSEEEQSEPEEQLGGTPESAPEKVSREQAERILQALEENEEELLKEVQRLKSRPRRVEKDW